MTFKCMFIYIYILNIIYDVKISDGNKKHISTEAFQNFLSVCLQYSYKLPFKGTELKKFD